MATDPIKASIEFVRLRSQAAMFVALSLAACSSPGGNPLSVGATRLIAPLSTATVTSQRPRLRWSLGPGADGAHVEICRDRACTMALATFDAVGASAAPPADLPADVVFWRVFGRTGAVTSPEPSATWQFTVGRRTAPVDTSWGSTVDVNGDGYSDLAVGAPFHGNIGHVYVHHGGPAGLGMEPAVDLSDATPASDFGVSVTSAGDVNGDGYADLAVGAPAVSSYRGRVYVYFGGSAGIDVEPAITIDGVDDRADFGRSLAPAGDVNGDGYADLAIGTPSPLRLEDGYPLPHVHVYLGSASGLATDPAITLDGIAEPGPATAFGGPLASAGDVNGDGYGDLLVGARSPSLPEGIAYVFHGSASGLLTTPATMLTRTEPNGEFGSAVTSVGDVNGDGCCDVAIGLGGVGCSAFGSTPEASPGSSRHRPTASLIPTGIWRPALSAPRSTLSAT